MDPPPKLPVKRALTPQASASPSVGGYQSKVFSAEELFGSIDGDVPKAGAKLLPSRSFLNTKDPGESPRVIEADTKRRRHDSDLGPVSQIIPEGSAVGDFLQFFVTGESFHSTYKVGIKIGEGGFGKVFLATHRVTGISRAVKRLSKSDGRGEARRNEIAALLALDHPHIVKLVEYFDEEQYVYLAFELCEGPDLFDRIVNEPTGRMAEADASIALRHMLKALQCCHAKYRGHYDIKPENFMYATADFSELMMIDLGLSSGFEAHRKHKIKGTEAYMAPECRRGIYGPEADIWSCGVVLFVMLTGQPFLPTVPSEKLKDELASRHLVKRRISQAASTFCLSEEAQGILSVILQHDRHARPTVKEALNHPFNRNSYEKELHDPLLQVAPPVTEALKIREHLVETFRTVAQESVLKRVARLAIAHVGGASIPERLAFRMLDVHGYGEISISAIEKDLELRQAPVPDDLAVLFRSMVMTNSNYISYLQFLSIILSVEAMTNESLCRVAFRMLDKSNDGFIEASELAGVLGHPAGSTICKRGVKDVCSDGRVSWKTFLEVMTTTTASST